MDERKIVTEKGESFVHDGRQLTVEQVRKQDLSVHDKESGEIFTIRKVTKHELEWFKRRRSDN